MDVHLRDVQSMDLVCAVHFFILLIGNNDCNRQRYKKQLLLYFCMLLACYYVHDKELCSLFCNIIANPPTLLLVVENFDNFYLLNLTFFLCATRSTTFMLQCARSILAMSFVEYEKNTAISLPIHDIVVQLSFNLPQLFYIQTS